MSLHPVQFRRQNLANSKFRGKQIIDFQVVADGNGGVVATAGDNNGFPAIRSWSILMVPLGTPDAGGFPQNPPEGFRVQVWFDGPLDLNAIGNDKAFMFYFYREGMTIADHYHH